jgi:hypothetical protein
MKLKPFPTPLLFIAAAVRSRGNGMVLMPPPKLDAKKGASQQRTEPLEVA